MHLSFVPDRGCGSGECTTTTVLRNSTRGEAITRAVAKDHCVRDDQRVSTLSGTGAAWWVLAGACVLVGSAAVTVIPMRSATIDLDRIEDHVGVIAGVPHPMGSPANDAVRAYRVSTLEAAGRDVQVQECTAPDYFGRPGRAVTGGNVLARVTGVDHRRAVLLVAHYDSVPTTPGANDNAAAVAALLEVGRVVGGTTPPNDVIVLLTDGEEPAPRFGATAFAGHRWLSDIALVANFEANGAGGPSLLVEMSGPGGMLIDHLSGAAGGITAFSFITDVTDLIGGVGTDFDIFRAAGIPGYNFAYLRDSSVYHTERDDLAALNLEGAGNHASIALGLATSEVPALDDAADATVFFTLPAGAVIRLDTGVVRLLSLSALLATFLVVGYRVRRGDTTTGLAARAVARTLSGLVLVGLAATVAWFAITSLRPTMREAEGGAWLMLIVAIAGVASWLVNRGRRDPITGSLVVWATMAALAGAPLPGLAVALTVPVLVADAAVVYAIAVEGRAHRVIRVIVVSVVTGVMVAPVIDTFFQLAVPRPGNPDSELLTVVAAPAMFAFMVIMLIAAIMGPFGVAPRAHQVDSV